MNESKYRASTNGGYEAKQDHSVSCFFQMLTIVGGFLLLSLSIAVWVNWIL